MRFQVLPFLGFALAMFLFYSTVPVILKVDWMYFIAFGAVAVGLVIYSGGSKNDPDKAQVAEAKERDEESGVNNSVQ